MKLLNIEDLKELHIFVDNLNYPIVIFIRNEWEKVQLSYLNVEKHDSESLCWWCINHNIRYQIFYPIAKKHIIQNPYKYYKFLQMKRRLGKR